MAECGLAKADVTSSSLVWCSKGNMERKIYYRKWNCPDDAECTEYYRIDARELPPKIIALTAQNDTLPNEPLMSDSLEWWGCMDANDEEEESLAVIMKDSKRSSRKEFIMVFAELYSLPLEAVEQIFKDQP